MPFVVCCALVYFWTLRFSRIGDFYTLRLGFFGNLDLRIIHVVKLQNALLGFAKSLTHNEDEAKDLLQETSLKALSNKAMYDDSGSIKSWLYTIMRNLFLNCRRHSSRQESLPTDFEIPDTDDMQGGIEGEDSFSTIDVQRIMDLLSIDNRILFGLYLQGYRYDEIADRLQMPLGTVKVRIYRIKQELRTYKKQLV